jgi:hypothetical protein
LFDEAWIAAAQEIAAIKDAKDAIDSGKDQDAFEREEVGKNDPADTRSIMDKIRDASAAWAEAL